MTTRASIARYSVPMYFALTFAISWGGVLLIVGGPDGMSGTAAQADPLLPLAILAMIAGPSVAGVLLTSLVHGKAGLRDFLSRLVEWRVGAYWHAVALASAPLLAATVFGALSFVSPEFLPRIFVTDDKASLVLFGLAVGLAAGLFEELGWTGFAVPELRRRYSIVTTGLIVGVLWGAWHMLVVAWGAGDRIGTLPLPVFVTLDTLSFLPAFRVLMVWVYDRTASLLVGILMHLSLTATTLILWPATTGGGLVTADLAFAIAVCLVVAAIAIAGSKRFSPHALHRPA